MESQKSNFQMMITQSPQSCAFDVFQITLQWLLANSRIRGCFTKAVTVEGWAKLREKLGLVGLVMTGSAKFGHFGLNNSQYLSSSQRHAQIVADCLSTGFWLPHTWSVVQWPKLQTHPCLAAMWTADSPEFDTVLAAGAGNWSILMPWMKEILHHQKDGWNPINNGINNLLTGARFLPSTVLNVVSIYFKCLSLSLSLHHRLNSTSSVPVLVGYSRINLNATADSSGTTFRRWVLTVASFKKLCSSSFWQKVVNPRLAPQYEFILPLSKPPEAPQDPNPNLCMPDIESIRKPSI